MSAFQVLSILIGGVTLVIIAVAFYLDHVKLTRSDVTLQSQRFSGAGFTGGSTDSWQGVSHLKITNAGEKTGLLADHRVEIDHLYQSPTKETEKQRDEPPRELEVYVPSHVDQLPDEARIQPGDIVPWRQQLRIKPTVILQDYDAVAIEHRFTIEDDQQTYDVSTVNLMGLTGPDIRKA